MGFFTTSLTMDTKTSILIPSGRLSVRMEVVFHGWYRG